MLRVVRNRKLYIDKHLGLVILMKNGQDKQTAMCMSYVLVCASVEYMVESLVRGWLKHNIKKHRYSYPKKKHVDELIGSLYANANVNLYRNNNIDYGTICDLVGKLAGTAKKTELANLVDAASPGGKNVTIEALKKISLPRHQIAHGANIPNEMSPNMSELCHDLNIVYNNLIINLDLVLKRK